MDFDFKDLLATEKTLKYKGKTITFKPLNTEDSIILISLLTELERFDIINKDEFFDLVNKSTGIPKEIVKESSIGFRIKALDTLLNLIDIDFFIDGSLGLKKLIDNLNKILIINPEKPETTG
ncbi:MAG TPA: hypothetical protein PLK41_04605 [Defluviitoga tunisiensis]|nr:hypothetical protein [bacterium]HPP10252.1 hypothetical protein [Defluviitoga tunisiensis]